MDIIRKTRNPSYVEPVMIELPEIDRISTTGICFSTAQVPHLEIQVVEQVLATTHVTRTHFTFDIFFRTLTDNGLLRVYKIETIGNEMGVIHGAMKW